MYMLYILYMLYMMCMLYILFTLTFAVPPDATPGLRGAGRAGLGQGPTVHEAHQAQAWSGGSLGKASEIRLWTK